MASDGGKVDEHTSLGLQMEVLSFMVAEHSSMWPLSFFISTCGRLHMFHTVLAS